MDNKLKLPCDALDAEIIEDLSPQGAGVDKDGGMDEKTRMICEMLDAEIVEFIPPANPVWGYFCTDLEERVRKAQKAYEERRKK